MSTWRLPSINLRSSVAYPLWIQTSKQRSKTNTKHTQKPHTWVCVRLYAWRSQARTFGVLCNLSHCLIFWNKFPSWTWRLLIQLYWLISETQGFSCLYAPPAGLQVPAIVLACDVAARDLNSGPHACTPRWLTGPSSQPLLVGILSYTLDQFIGLLRIWKYIIGSGAHDYDLL